MEIVKKFTASCTSAKFIIKKKKTLNEIWTESYCPFTLNTKEHENLSLQSVGVAKQPCRKNAFRNLSAFL